jgi:hypothetical protein
LYFGLVLCALQAADDTLPPAQVKAGGATIEVTFAPGKIDLGEPQILAWITTAAEAVTEYFGRFPLPHPRISVRPAEGRSGVFRGTTYGSEGGFTRISVGQLTDRQELDNDWMMTHELIHMAFPDIAGEEREHHWIEEGMATYIEPIARCQIGKLKVERVWGEMARYMPQGLPRDGDQGLDNTHTWGRTYWGGALYWLMADVQIRQRRNNQKGLQDAMRAIVAAGGTIDHEWPIEHVLEIGDRATGSTVLVDLYNRMKSAPVQTDLDEVHAVCAEIAAETIGGANEPEPNGNGGVLCSKADLVTATRTLNAAPLKGDPAVGGSEDGSFQAP